MAPFSSGFLRTTVKPEGQTEHPGLRPSSSVFDLKCLKGQMGSWV